MSYGRGEISDALVEKAAQVIVEHPSIPNAWGGPSDPLYYCPNPTCGVNDIAGPSSPSQARHLARAVLTALADDLRRVEKAGDGQ